MVPTLQPGYVRALVERPGNDVLVAAANELLQRRDPTRVMSSYRVGDDLAGEFTVDPTFGAIPIGRGAEHEAGEDLRTFLQPDKSERFLVNGFVNVEGRSVPEYLSEKGQRYPVHSNPPIFGLQRPPPCLPTCGTSQYVGTSSDIRDDIDFQTLQDNGLDR